jgi:hypothetical protein
LLHRSILHNEKTLQYSFVNAAMNATNEVILPPHLPEKLGATEADLFARDNP